MNPSSPSAASPPPQLEQQRQALLTLLRREPRGAAKRDSQQVQQLIVALERAMPADLTAPKAQEQLEGVWELRWSSSSQPYLAVAPWLENLQLLAPSQGRGMNLLRLTGPLAPLASIAVEASISLDPWDAQASTPAASEPTRPQQRVQVRFRRGGWLGPALGAGRLQLLRSVQQSFPAWLDITVLDDELRVCRGNAGTLFALLRRPDLNLEEMMLPPGAGDAPPRGEQSRRAPATPQSDGGWP